MDKIVFFHMNQLGDLLFSLPTLKAAKEQWKGEITCIVKSSLAPLLTSAGLAGKIIPKEMNFIELVKTLHAEKFDKAVLFSESPSSVLAAYFSNIKERTGFETASLSFFLTNKAKREGVPSLFNDAELAKTADLANVSTDYTGILNIPEESMRNVQNWFKENNINSSKVIAVSTGASKKRQDKRLEDSKWIEVIDTLSEKGFSCVLSGAKWEKEDLTALSEKCRTKPKVFSADNGILESAAFLKSASLFIGTDSGAMHLAAALGTKCIGIFGNTDPLQIGPMPLEKHIIIKKDTLSRLSASDIINKVL